MASQGSLPREAMEHPFLRAGRVQSPLPEDDTGLLGSAPASLPRPSPSPWSDAQRRPLGYMPLGHLSGGRISLETSRPRGEPLSQSSKSVFQFERDRGMPALGKGQHRARHIDCLYLGTPSTCGPQCSREPSSYPSITITTDIYEVCPCARHMDPVGAPSNLKVAAIVIPVSRCGG